MVACQPDRHYSPFGINSSRVRDGKIILLDSSRQLRSTLNFLRDSPKGDVLRLAGLCSRLLLNQQNRCLGSRYFPRLGGVAMRLRLPRIPADISTTPRSTQWRSA